MVMSETLSDLVKRDGLYYKKFSQVPFTGKTTGKSQGSFKNGKRDGAWVSYHENGQLDYKGDYKNGKEEGDWVGYNKDGTMWKRFTGTFKDGKKISD
jgi:antitoxin component YwqK of YwqJK toxin-antitoxin module